MRETVLLTESPPGSHMSKTFRLQCSGRLITKTKGEMCMIWIFLEIHLQINTNKVNIAFALLVTVTILRDDHSGSQRLYVSRTAIQERIYCPGVVQMFSRNNNLEY